MEPALILTLDLPSAGVLAVPPAVIVILILVLPWPVTRFVLIPLGFPRAAFVLMHFSPWTWFGRRRSAILAAAWASIRSRRDERDFLDALEKMLADLTPIGVQEICGYGLVAYKRGQVDDARALFASVETILDGPSLARAIAGEWCAADAAQRGEWDRVSEIALRDSLPTRATMLLGAVSARLLDLRSVSPSELWLRWAIAPHRIDTLPIVRRALALAAGSATKVAPDPIELPPVDDAVARAMTHHAALLRRPKEAVLATDLSRVAALWDDALASTSDAGSRELSDTVRQDLAELMRIVAPDPAGEGRTLRGALEKLRAVLVSDLELAAGLLERRVAEKRALPAVDEWREWLAVERQASQALSVGDAKLERMMFSALHGPVCSLAVWLFNTRGERHIAHAIFRWLLARAEALGDEEAIRLQRGNVNASSAGRA